MKIASIVNVLEMMAPPFLQESYDNAGLLTGNSDWECTGILCTLDSTEAIVAEAIEKKCNLIVAHHPIVFGGLKKITGKTYVERTVIAAIKHDIAIYAIHTNLDNVIEGVSGRMADRLGLVNRSVLAPRDAILRKLFTFVPVAHAGKVRQAIFDAGGGHIGNYSECSFNAGGTGTYKAGEGAQPYAGEPGTRHEEQEYKIEVIFPAHRQAAIINAMVAAHPYEEVAYDVVALLNNHPGTGSGLVGELPGEIDEAGFFSLLKDRFDLKLVRHTAHTGRPLKRVALCGGAGSFLISKALAARADVFITADMKYHEFFDADGRMLICDIGHHESEQFTISLLAEHLQQKFLNFAVLKSEINTNPVYYYF